MFGVPARRWAHNGCVKRWGIVWGVAAIVSLAVWAARSASASLLADTDTVALLEGLARRTSVWSWFVSDWPLGNHFYRPLPTLTFAWDAARGGAAAFGATNALLAAACVWALAWALRELTDRPWMAALGTGLFGAWLVGAGGWMEPLCWAVAVGCGACVFLGGRKWRPALLAAGVWVFIGAETTPIAPLRARIIEWLPGRTASLMALFALLSLACYARYERVGASRSVPAFGPLDPPATKGTAARAVPGRFHALWGGGALLCLVAALCSYEQAVMLPAVLLGAAICLQRLGYGVRWGWHGAFWACVPLYLWVRHAVLPAEVSAYQHQQFREGPGVMLSLLDYLAPGLSTLWTTGGVVTEGPLVLLTPTFWTLVTVLGANLAIVLASRRRPAWVLGGWALSTLAFLPMAWLKSFEHYHVWPMALRSLFVVACVAVGWDAAVSAMSRPVLGAPTRLSPAPGSLPRP